MNTKVILLELDKPTITRNVWSSLKVQEYLNKLDKKPKQAIPVVLAGAVKFMRDTPIFDLSKICFLITDMKIEEHASQKFLVGNLVFSTRDIAKFKVPDFNISRRYFNPVIMYKDDAIIAIRGFTFDPEGVLIKPKPIDSNKSQSHITTVA